MENKNIYLDNSAATRLDEKVLEAMKPFLFETYAVASSEFGYSMGIKTREALAQAREWLAKDISADAEELIFTSGATESSNIAIKSSVEKLSKKEKNHIITSQIEDFPVLNSCKKLENQGFRVTYLPVDENGFVDPAQLEKAITDHTILVSIQHANQEIGTVQDIAKIGKICKENDVLFHTDATHTFRRLPIDVNKFNIDLVTLSAHTIHGPKGIGGLYVRKGTPLAKYFDGGFQEFDKRPGLVNIPGAVGFAKAAELVTEEENNKLTNLRDHLINRILDEIPKTTLNGHRKKRVPQNANITFHLVEGESITLHMDMRGFSLSTGSACFSNSLEASHVILGIGGDHERAHGSVRFSLSRYNTKEQVDRTVDEISDVIQKLRDISPLSNGSEQNELQKEKIS
ncbi:MAG: cysteine desulfurase [Candidatus Marinimicrobia bacterium]|nr:cysteine desulfurase [Candidatus Neomarinimicrobiota bacterium]